MLAAAGDVSAPPGAAARPPERHGPAYDHEPMRDGQNPTAERATGQPAKPQRTCDPLARLACPDDTVRWPPFDDPRDAHRAVRRDQPGDALTIKPDAERIACVVAPDPQRERTDAQHRRHCRREVEH